MWKIDFFNIQCDGVICHITAKFSETDSDEGRTFESFAEAKKFLIEQATKFYGETMNLEGMT